MCDLLGEENVWDFPHKRSYHYNEIHHYNRPWVGGAPGMTAPFEFAKLRTVPEHSEQEILDTLRSDGFDFVIVGSSRWEPMKNVRAMRGEIRTPKIVLHDGEDFADIDFYGLARSCNIRLYLKRELLQGCGHPSGFVVKSFPMSCSLMPKKIPKEIDLLCAVGETHASRNAAKDVVATIPETRAIYGYWPWTKYIELTSQSRIAVAPRGHGQDTLRRWEIPAFDTLLFCERLNLHEENPLRDGEHCVYYDNSADLKNKLVHWLSHEEDRQRVAEAGQAFVQQHHTTRARAQRVVDWIREVYG